MQRGSTDDKTPQRFTDRVWVDSFMKYECGLKQSFPIIAVLHNIWFQLCTCN